MLLKRGCLQPSSPPVDEEHHKPGPQGCIQEGERKKYPSCEWAIVDEYRHDLFPLSDLVIAERYAILPEVLVGNCVYDHYRHRYYVEDEDHCPAHRSLAYHAEERYPEQGVCQVEEYVRLHQIEA